MQPEWPSAVERGQIERALAGADVDKLTIVVETHSPWLQVDAWVHMKGTRRLALWRATGAVYAVDEHGAVDDDLIIPPGWGQADIWRSCEPQPYEELEEASPQASGDQPEPDPQAQ